MDDIELAREAVALADKGYSAVSIAERLNQPLEHVRTWVQRALKKHGTRRPACKVAALQEKYQKGVVEILEGAMEQPSYAAASRALGISQHYFMYLCRKYGVPTPKKEGACKHTRPVPEAAKKAFTKRHPPVEYDGLCQSISAWAKDLDVKRTTLNWRITHWGIERAFRYTLENQK